MTVLDTHPENAFANDRAHVFHSWSAQGALSPLVVEGAEGSYFWTQDGTRYLDFSSQLVNVNIGHQHPKLIAAIKQQADQLCTVAPFHANDARSEAARLICEVAAEKIDKSQLNMVFFTNGGAEATENAVRMARLHTNRLKVLSHYRSYHGGTNGAISMTGDPRRWGSEPGMPGVVKFWGPYAYRSAFHSTSEAEECQRALAHLDDVLMVEGGHTVAAIIIETVVGTNGILVPPDGYLQGIRDRCDRHGIVMICDEVMAGFGRCGEWFAFQKWGVQPDLVCFAKGVNSGYLPLGGVVISQNIADTFRDRAFPGGWGVGADAAPDAVERALREAGFTDVTSRSFDEPHDWTLEAVSGYLQSTSVCSRAALGDDFEAFETDLRATLLAEVGPGPFHEDLNFGYTLGRKPG